jgi:acetolactate synthase-1/3 small subunit
MNEMSHTISLLVANKPGVLLRISLIFSRRGFNVESLVVSPTLEGGFSRMTITASGQRESLEQIIKQAQKLVDVIHVNEYLGMMTVEKELALIKVAPPSEKRNEVLQVVQHFKAETVDLNQDSIIIQVTGSTEKLDAIVAMLMDYNMLEIVRTGKIMMLRGKERT